MISLYYDKKSGYGKIGLEHFIYTYGIILNDSDSFVDLFYGKDSGKNQDSKFRVTVKNAFNTNDFEKMVEYGSKIFNCIQNSENPGEFIRTNKFILIKENSIDLDLDIFSFIGRFLSEDNESFWKSLTKSEKERLGKVPLVDVYERMLFLILLYTFEKVHSSLVCKAFWPGKKFAVCLTHDVDELKKTYQWVTRPIKYLKNRQMHLLKGQLDSFWYRLHGKEPFWTFNEIMEVEEKLNVKSSFYFLKEESKARFFAPDTWKLLGRRYDYNEPKVRRILKQLNMGGWDIGLHGSYESYNNPELLEKEKNDLQISMGDRVSGIRQHHLNLDIPKTWEYHDKIGLKYDTTLGFKDQMGFKGSTCYPFHPYLKQKRLNLLEIPLVIMDTPLFKNKKDILSNDFEEMIRTVSGFNGVLTLLWHHVVFNDHEYPGWSADYKKTIELCKEKDAWITSAKEICEWWIYRERTNLECDYRDEMLKIKPHPGKGSHYLNVYLPKSMILNKISNAKVLENKEDLLTIITDPLKSDEYVEIEFSELDNGN